VLQALEYLLRKHKFLSLKKEKEEEEASKLMGLSIPARQLRVAGLGLELMFLDHQLQILQAASGHCVAWSVVTGTRSPYFSQDQIVFDIVSVFL
jgi:hypothetical protein